MTIVDTLSAALIEAHSTGNRADARELPLPSYDQALEIQRRVQAQLGPVSGFKVARRPEGPPVIAPIRADLTRPTGAIVPARDQIGIELEIGFELMADPTAGMMEHPQNFFRPRIVIEIVDTRLTGAEDAPMLKLADMQINAGLIVGPEYEDWRGDDFTVISAALRCGDRQVIEGDATVPGGSALGNLAHFCTHVGDHCGGLRKGQIVITGSLSGLEYFPKGTEVLGRIEGFGSITCQLG